MTHPAQILAGLPGGYEWLIILVIFLLLFGRRLPGVARSLGQGISSFKKGLNDPLTEEKKEEERLEGGSTTPDSSSEAAKTEKEAV